MHVRTDDDIYRVDSVWLGPPRATFPWRVRYVGYGVGLLVMIAVMFVQRRVGIGLDFFSVAWALVVTVVVTRFVGTRINDERPLGQVLGMFRHEVTGPRRRTGVLGGAVRSRHVRVRSGTPGAAPAPRGVARSGAGKSGAGKSAATADRGVGKVKRSTVSKAPRPPKAPKPVAATVDPWARSQSDPWASAGPRREAARTAKGRGRRATA
ncbi:MAG: hypothetical protein ACT4RN_06020 [Pseudonocardia sp.]